MKNIWIQLENNGHLILILMILLHLFCKVYFPGLLMIVKILLSISLISYLTGVYKRRAKRGKSNIVTIAITVIACIAIAFFIYSKGGI